MYKYRNTFLEEWKEKIIGKVCVIIEYGSGCPTCGDSDRISSIHFSEESAERAMKYHSSGFYIEEHDVVEWVFAQTKKGMTTKD